MLTKSVVVVLFGAVLLSVTSARTGQAQTLGELALKEEARRKALKASAGAKVLTNDDLPRGVPPAPAAPAAAKADGAKTSKPEDTAKAEDPAKTEAWWKQRMNQEREALRRSEMFADALQTRINSLTNDFASRDDPYQRARIGEDRGKALAELERVNGESAAIRKKMVDIEEEARKSGVPPGWLR